MSRVVLKIVGAVSIALAVFTIPLSFVAGNPAVLGKDFGGLLAGAILMGMARVIDPLEQLVERKGLPC